MFLLSISLVLFYFIVCITSTFSQTTKDFDPTKVVVVISHGTSGSTEFCELLGNLVGHYFGRELLGGNSRDMKANRDPLNTVINFLKSEQREYPNSIVGFKYKPYHHDDAYEKLWEWMAKKNIKVIYNTRNPLDVMIGTFKSKEGGKHNCDVGRTDCIEKQLALTFNVNVSLIIEKVHELQTEYMLVKSRIKAYKLNSYYITYEGVNHGTVSDRVAYVQNIANFIQPGKFDITDKVFDVRTAYIGHYHQKEMVTNYDELVAAVQDTELVQYLH